MLTTYTCSLVAVLALISGCGKHDNSADTDRASEDLRNARAQVTENSKDLSANQEAIEKQRAALAAEQTALADKQKLLAQQEQQLGHAQVDLQQARATYAAAVTQRLAKLDAALANLGAASDARAKDVLVGLRARRDQLAAKLAAMPAATDPSWVAFTKDTDVTFDAIEHDVGEAH
jgi:chromosome segregation ATPase